MKPELLQRIKGQERLTAIFEGWPSFHDGTVELLVHKPGGFLELTCRIFRMTAELDAKGYYICNRHTRTKLRFDGCEEIKLRSIYAGAAIFELKLEEAILEHPPRVGWQVQIDSSTEFELELTCTSVEVIEANPVTNHQGD